MQNGYLSEAATTIFFSTAVVLLLIVLGFITFGIAVELENARHPGDASARAELDPNTLPPPASGKPAPAVGGPQYDLGRLASPVRSQGSGRSQESGHPEVAGSPGDCDGIIYRVAENGVRYVREAGGGRYYGAEVDHTFGIYTLEYGYLVKIEDSSLDTETYRKLKYALYNCNGVFTQSGIHIALNVSTGSPS